MHFITAGSEHSLRLQAPQRPTHIFILSLLSSPPRLTAPLPPSLTDTLPRPPATLHTEPFLALPKQRPKEVPQISSVAAAALVEEVQSLGGELEERALDRGAGGS